MEKLQSGEESNKDKSVTQRKVKHGYNVEIWIQSEDEDMSQR